MTDKEQHNAKETGYSCDCATLMEQMETEEKGCDCSTMMSKMAAAMQGCDCTEMMEQCVNTNSESE